MTGTAGPHDRLGQTVAGWIRRRPIVAFLFITFAWSWGHDAVVYLTVGPSPGILLRGIVRAWGPLIAAGLVTWAIGGSLRAWAGQVTRWRVGLRWYAVAIALPLLWEDGVAVSVVHWLTGGQVQILPSPWWHYVANFLVVLFLAGGLEEFGWRGFAQTRLQERYSAVLVAAGIGLAWAAWHLPLFFLFEVPAYDASRFWTSYTVGLVFSSVILAWIYNVTGGSLLFPMLVHSLGNLPAVVAPVGPIGIAAEYTTEAFGLVVVVGIIALYGSRHLAAERTSPAVPGSGRTAAEPIGPEDL